MVRFLFLNAFLFIPVLTTFGPLPLENGYLWAAGNFCAALFVCLYDGPSLWRRVAIALVISLVAVLSTLLAVSYVTQGKPFNHAFFAHLDTSTLQAAWRTDWWKVLAAVFYLAAAVPAALWRVPTPGFISRAVSAIPGLLMRYKVPVILCLCVLLNYPLIMAASHAYNSNQASARLDAEVAFLRSQTVPDTIEVGAAKNLVLLYLEGFEQTFFDTSRFPGLVPELSALRDEGVSFVDMRQYPGTEWTIAGIIASQCGVPMLSRTSGSSPITVGNRILKEIDNPYRDITCLAEVLSEAGYITQYIGGASLDFAAKGDFLSDNGYQSTLGFDELPHATRSGWGIYDEDLFRHSTQLFDGLAQADQPFFMTLLTLDTHHPDGEPSPTCGPHPTDTLRILFSVNCSDRMVADFVRYIQASDVADDTVIAIMSDHLSIRGDVLRQFEDAERRLLFFILDPSRPPEVRDGMASHFDVAPTLLEAVGIDGASFAFGHSLLSNPEGRVAERALTQDDFSGFYIETLMATDEPTDEP